MIAIGVVWSDERRCFSRFISPSDTPPRVYEAVRPAPFLLPTCLETLGIRGAANSSGACNTVFS